MTGMRTTFKELAIGAMFEFDHTELGVFAIGVAWGPWLKVSARCYTDPTRPGRNRVGSINVAVRRLPIVSNATIAVS